MALLVFPLVGAYLLGSIPTSVLAARRVRKIDIRAHGSGNAGATNVLRVVGWKAALFVAAVDVTKGFLPALLVLHFWPRGLPPAPLTAATFTAASAVLGHVYPVWSGFRGGKGVGTAAGAMAALFPLPVALCAGVFAAGVLATRGMVSVGSCSAALALPLSVWAVEGSGWIALRPAVFLTLCALALFILFTHRSNLVRLAKGSENRLGRRT